jgi:3-deoxy-7-phosphoheptulonate synthase
VNISSIQHSNIPSFRLYRAMPRVTDLHVVTNTALPAPQDMVQEIPRTETHAEFVAKARGEIENILSGKDERLLW